MVSGPPPAQRQFIGRVWADDQVGEVAVERSEFLLEHGFLDAVVKRGEMKAYLAHALKFFCD